MCFRYLIRGKIRSTRNNPLDEKLYIYNTHCVLTHLQWEESNLFQPERDFLIDKLGILKHILTEKEKWYDTIPVTSDHTKTGKTAVFPKSWQKAATQSRKESSAELNLRETQMTTHNVA